MSKNPPRLSDLGSSGGGVCLIIRKNAAVLRSIFPYQSFFDNTQLNQAILTQDPNSPTVNEISNVNVSGRTVGLHPDSQCPIAARLKSQTGQVVSVLTPGQVVNGLIPDGFTSLDWGLPFGWLGGGLAKLVIADSDAPFVGWAQAKTEVLLQRQRMQIVADASPSTSPAASAANWAGRFPMKNGYRYNSGSPSTPIPQSGQPEIAAEITRIVMRLRVANLAAPTPMRILIRGLDEFDIGSDGVTITYTDLSVFDVQWPQQVAGMTSAPYPTIEIRDIPAALRGDSCVVTLSDAKNAALTNQFVDVLTYGRI